MSSHPTAGEGAAFLYSGTGPDHDSGRNHIMVVVKELAATGDYLIVPICSYKEKCDKTCVLTPGVEWPKIRKKSFVSYSQGKKVSKRSVLDRTIATPLGRVPTTFTIGYEPELENRTSASPGSKSWYFLRLEECSKQPEQASSTSPKPVPHRRYTAHLCAFATVAPTAKYSAMIPRARLPRNSGGAHG